jgi:predicted nucleic acid-binding protein
VGIGAPVLAELVSGIERSKTRECNMQRLRGALASLRVWPFERPAAFEYGRIHADLLSRGRQMQVVDMMIAAIAIVFGSCTVVSSDRDLTDVPGLAVENWTA